MSGDDDNGDAAAHERSWAEALEQARPRIKDLQATMTSALDQILAAADEIAR